MDDLQTALVDVTITAGYKEGSEGVANYCQTLSWQPEKIAERLESAKQRFIMNRSEETDKIIATLSQPQ